MPNIIMLLIIILLGLFTKSKNKNVPLRYWLLLLSVPVTTLGTLTVYQYYIDRLAPGEEINAYIIVSTIGILFINVLVFKQTTCATQHHCSVEIVHGVPCLMPQCAYHTFDVCWFADIIFSANSKSSSKLYSSLYAGH